MDRAHTVFQIKAIDEDQRIITGVASTITADRVGDVLEPKGAQFTLPIPLLWQHDHDRPIGEVFAAKTTATDIEIQARIARITEPGPLKDIIETAWQAIKARLVKGLSVGWRPVEAARIAATGGLHALKWLWFELSVVTVPANAEATISTIKALDVDRSAAFGTAAGVPSSLPGVTGASQRDRLGSRSMNISEKLTAAKASLKTKSARLEELMTASDTAALSDAEQIERSTLTTEVKGLNADVETYSALEAAQASQAAPIAIKHQEATTRTETRVTVEPPKLPPGIEFTRAVMCLMKEAATKGRISALDIARKQFPDYPRIQAYLKAAVDPMTTADGTNTGGTELVYATNLVSEFIDFLRPQTIVGKFGTNGIPSLRRVPFNVRITGQTTGGAGYWVGQGQPKPLKKFDFNATTLGFSKVAAISVLSDELVRFSSPAAEGLVRDALAGSLIERLDTDFVDPGKVAVANVSPASITNSVAGIASSGTDAAAVRVDIQALLAPFIAANISPSAGVFITTETVGLTLSLMMNALGQPEFPQVTMRGGTLVGFPVITSQYCAGVGSPSGDILIFCNASDIFLSDDGQVTIDASREASLEMEDSPASPTEGTVVSMYQNNLIALRAERYINWAKRRAAAAQWIVDVAYVSGSPA